MPKIAAQEPLLLCHFSGAKIPHHRMTKRRGRQRVDALQLARNSINNSVTDNN